MSKPPIKTEFVYPPIPVRDFDWAAYRDGWEPGELQGTGRTKEAAIADLLEQEEEAEE